MKVYRRDPSPGHPLSNGPRGWESKEGGGPLVPGRFLVGDDCVTAGSVIRKGGRLVGPWMGPYPAEGTGGSVGAAACEYGTLAYSPEASVLLLLAALSVAP